MTDSLIYCVGDEVFIYLVVDLPQASTFNTINIGLGSSVCERDRNAVTGLFGRGIVLVTFGGDIVSGNPKNGRHVAASGSWANTIPLYVLEYKPLNAARECGVTIFSNSMLEST
jgi:hypothetical protein